MKILHTCSMRSLGCSFTESTSTNRVGCFRQSNGRDWITCDRDRIDVQSSTTSLSDSRNASVSLLHHLAYFITVDNKCNMNFLQCVPEK